MTNTCDIMELYFLRIISLVIIGFIYLIFDIFNKRNIPSLAVYSFLGYGVLLTLLYLNLHTIITSSLIAVAIISFGYILYKIGILGLGDIFELASLSLIFPFLKNSFFYNMPQFNIPFIVSVLLNSGLVAIVLIPIFYLIKYKINIKKPILKSVTKKQALKAGLIAISYFAFIMFLVILFGFKTSFLIIILIAIFSVIMILFEMPITNTMISYVNVNAFEEDELIAMNLINDQEARNLKKKFKHFNRLITKQLIKEMKQKHFKEKLPVYKEPIPFASMIFLGLVLGLGFGNIFLFIFLVIH